MRGKCMAYRDDGRICGAEAIVVDRIRGCMVCAEHAPKCERCGKYADVYGSDGERGEYLCFKHMGPA